MAEDPYRTAAVLPPEEEEGPAPLQPRVRRTLFWALAANGANVFAQLIQVWLYGHWYNVVLGLFHAVFIGVTAKICQALANKERARERAMHALQEADAQKREEAFSLGVPQGGGAEEAG